MAEKVIPLPSEAHRRGISVTLTILDEMLCEIEEWAKGRQRQSVLYQERNELTTEQRRRVLSEVAGLRGILQQMCSDMPVDGDVRDAADAIRSMCCGLREYAAELSGRHLRRYGNVPGELATYMDTRSEELLSGLSLLSEAVGGRRGRRSPAKDIRRNE